ncbi:MAG: hypothetical protein WCK67_00935 [bacterium]
MINLTLPTVGRVITPIMSNLDNPSSLWLVGAKDMVDVCGRTTMAYNEGSKHSKESGVHEARERFIEEVGTSVVWLGGIPACRWAFDKVSSLIPAFKDINPHISLKKINSEGVQCFSHGINQDLISAYLKDENAYGKLVAGLGDNKNKFIELGKTILKNKNASEEEILKAGLGVLNKSKYKSYNIAKLVVSTLVPFAFLAYALPKFNQGLTKKLIEEKRSKEPSTKSNYPNLAGQSLQQGMALSVPAKNTTFTAILEKHSKKQVAFGGIIDKLANQAASAQIDPVGNMIAVDFAISGSRVLNARNNDERAEIALREGGIIFFFFFASKIIKDGLATIADKINLPINLDFKALDNNKALFKNFKPVEIFANANKDNKFNEEKVIKFITGNLNNKTGEFTDELLKTAQKMGIIEVIEQDGKHILNPSKFIEVSELKNLYDHVGNFINKAGKAINEEKALDSLITKTKVLKGGMTILNMALCSISLGYLLPKLQYIFREHRTGTSVSPGLKAYADCNSTTSQAEPKKKLQAFL